MLQRCDRVYNSVEWEITEENNIKLVCEIEMLVRKNRYEKMKKLLMKEQLDGDYDRLDKEINKARSKNGLLVRRKKIEWKELEEMKETKSLEEQMDRVLDILDRDYMYWREI